MWWFAALPALACSLDETPRILDDTPSRGVVPPGAWIGVKAQYASGDFFVVRDDGSETLLDAGWLDGWSYARLPDDLPPGSRTWGFAGDERWLQRTVEIGEVAVGDDFAVPEAVATSVQTGTHIDGCDTASEPAVIVRSSWTVPVPPAAGWMLEIVDEDGATVDLQSWQMGGDWEVEEVRARAVGTVCHALNVYDALHEHVGSVEPACADVQDAHKPGCGCQGGPAGTPRSLVLLAIGALVRRRRAGMPGSSTRRGSQR